MQPGESSVAFEAGVAAATAEQADEAATEAAATAETAVAIAEGAQAEAAATRENVWATEDRVIAMSDQLETALVRIAELEAAKAAPAETTLPAPERKTEKKAEDGDGEVEEKPKGHFDTGWYAGRK